MKLSEVLTKYKEGEYRTDKNSCKKLGHCYGLAYDQLFKSFDREAKLDFVEIGIQFGVSMLAWSENFPNANLTGINIIDELKFKDPSIEYVIKDVKDFKPTMVEIIYYTDNRLRHTDLDKLVRQQILKSNLPIISVSLRPMDFGRNIVFEGKRGHSTMFKQVLTGLKASQADYIFLCEHDVLYHPSHFEFIPPKDDVYFYNINVYKYRLADRKVVKYDCDLLSQICANRELLIQHYEKKLAIIAGGGKAYGYEPGTGQSKIVDNFKAERFTSRLPNIDIRHGKNWTGVTRMDPSEFRNKSTCQNWQEYKVEDIPGWDTKTLLSINQII